MLLRDISFKTPEENILFDDVLLRMGEEGHHDDVLRFWESEKLFVVLGRIGKVMEDINVKDVMRDHIPVLRRSSGGGTVLQGKGCLNYSLVLSKERYRQISDIRQSYEFILGKVVAALKNLKIESAFFPVSDIALVRNSKKISGNAQKRGKKCILHHGTILYNFDIEKIEQYLKIPKDIPAYREGRGHRDFLINVPSSREEIKEALKTAFAVGRQEDDIKEEEGDVLKSFFENKNVLVDLNAQQIN